MPVRKSFIPSALGIIVVLAGCTGGTGGQLSEDGPITYEPVGEGDASLEVLVIDDALLPLKAATVGLKEVEATRITTEEGIALFEGLDAGTYTLEILRIGYESVARQVEVAPGVVTQFDVSLTQLLATEPYHEIFDFNGYMSCGAGLIGVAVTSNCESVDDHRVAFDSEVALPLESMVTELHWQQSSGLAAQELRITMGQHETCNPCNYEFDYGETQGPNPIYVVTSGSFKGVTEENEPNVIRHHVWTPFSSSDGAPVIVVAQSVTLYATFFYYEEAPDGYSSAPDA